MRTGPYRFYFFSHQPKAPPHIHVDRDASSAKFWLDPMGLARNLGFNARELNRLQWAIAEKTRQSQRIQALCPVKL
ncbi:MAG TPA: DUF4160 domain-containing protein [Blastocatellia bacterium]|nr:DUF4160 domain-containing protein [Blastocatellia bacterium]